MPLKVTYDCPFCGHAVEGRGVRYCPNCKLQSTGDRVADFDEALQALADARQGWDKCLGENEGLTGEQVYNDIKRIRRVLHALKDAARGLNEAVKELDRDLTRS